MKKRIPRKQNDEKTAREKKTNTRKQSKQNKIDHNISIITKNKTRTRQNKTKKNNNN